MTIKYSSLKNHINKLAIILILLNLIFSYSLINCYAVDYNPTGISEKKETLNLNEIVEANITQQPLNNMPDDIQDNIENAIYNSLDNLLDKDNFDLMNSRLWRLKVLLSMWAPFFCNIVNPNNFTIKAVLISQFIVPRTIESLCFLIDKVSITCHNTKPQYFLQKKVRPLFAKILFTVVLTPIASLLSAKIAAHGCKTIFERYTSNESALAAAYHIGFFANIFYNTTLFATFFYQLITQMLLKTGLENASKIYNPSVKCLEHAENIYILKELYDKCELLVADDTTNLDSTIEQYLSDRNINSIYKVASLQQCLKNKTQLQQKNMKVLLKNACEFFIIAGVAAIGAMSFYYINRSNMMLGDFIEHVGNKQENGSYVFKLKNSNSTFSCDSKQHCINEIDFNKIFTNQNQQKIILDPRVLYSISNVLQCVAISSDAIIILLSAIGMSYDILTSKIQRKAFKKGMFKKSKILQLCGAVLILPSMIYCLENIANLGYTAKKADDLLESIGENSQNFISSDVATLVTISALGISFLSGAKLLANIPNAIVLSLKKLSTIVTASMEKIYPKNCI